MNYYYPITQKSKVSFEILFCFEIALVREKERRAKEKKDVFIKAC